MARPRTIVGIGEALQLETPDRTGPGGLAIDVAMVARQLGHVGVPVSRLGQDRMAEDLLKTLRDAGVEASHLQSDPDLPTGRLVIRSIAGRVKQSLEARTAFDNLQWDFDLVDLAQHADAVVTGMLARRGGLSESTITRFLSESETAVRVCDLTNRCESGFSRHDAAKVLEQVEVAVMDDEAGRIMQLAAADDLAGAVQRLIRQTELVFVYYAQPGKPPAVFTQDQAHTGEAGCEAALHHAALIGLLHGVLEGRDFPACLHLAERVAGHVREHPDQPVPAKMLAS